MKPKELIIRTSNGHGKRIAIERAPHGETLISITGGGGGAGYCYLSPSEKATLLDFLNKPEPREWMFDVRKGTTDILGCSDNCTHHERERIKVREVMDAA